MARAKRTDRAEARRKYRAYLAQQAEAEEADEEEQPAPATRAKSGRRDDAPVPKPGQRVGMGQALKLATRPVHYIDDLKYAPTLITRSNAIWIPAGISIVSLFWGLTRTDFNDGTVAILYQFLLPMTPIIQPMIAGYLAPRASWLAGMIASVITGICFLILVYWWLGPTSHLANVPTTSRIEANQLPGLAFEVMFTEITFGALLGAASAWYKRFLSYLGAGNQRSASKAAPRRSAVRR